MGDTLEKVDRFSDELLEESIPCKQCGQPAQLRAVSHRCDGPRFRCYKCWKKWHANISMILEFFDAIRCDTCQELFKSVEEFSDYEVF